MKLTLFLTEQCNRKCKYCDIGNLKKRNKPPLIYLKKYLPIIRDKSSIDKVVLTGGEIGLLSETILDYIFEILQTKNIHVNTNGLFIQRYYKKYKEYINTIMCHPVSEINEEFNPYDIKNINYHFPVHKQNIYLLDDFLNRYKDITFEISPYDSKLKQSKFELNHDDYQTIYKIIKNKNATIYSKNLFFKILMIWNKQEKYRKICREKSNDFSIDLVYGKIKKCVCSHTNSASIDLTINNLNDMLKIKFDNSDVCNTCFHFINNIKV